MSYEVDVASGPGLTLTIASNCLFGPQPPTASVTANWPGEIAVGQWFAAAIQIDNDNPAGASVEITSQAPILHADGSQHLNLTFANVSQIPCFQEPNSDDPIQFAVNILSTPSHQ